MNQPLWRKRKDWLVSGPMVLWFCGTCEMSVNSACLMDKPYMHACVCTYACVAKNKTWACTHAHLGWHVCTEGVELARAAAAGHNLAFNLSVRLTQANVAGRFNQPNFIAYINGRQSIVNAIMKGSGVTSSECILFLAYARPFWIHMHVRRLMHGYHVHLAS